MSQFGYMVFFTLCFVFTVLPALDHYTVYKKIEVPHKILTKKIDSAIPKIIADLKQLDKHPIYTEFNYKNNAEQLFAKELSWSYPDKKQKHSFNQEKLQNFAAKYKDWRRNENTFQAMLKDPEIHLIDTGWLSEIGQYDHWNIATSSHIADKLATAAKTDILNRLEIYRDLPIPDFFELRSWALVQLIKEHKNVNTHKGLEVYRKMAFLSYSSGTLIGAQIAAQMLADEKLFTTRLEVVNWPHYDEQSIQAFKRVTSIWPTIVKSSFAENINIELLDYFKPEFGVCAAVFDSSDTLKFRDLLEPRFVLESAHINNLDRFEATYNQLQNNCNSKSFQVFSARSPASTDSWFYLNESVESSTVDSSSNTNFLQKINIAKIPYVRRIFAALVENKKDDLKFKYYD